MHSHTQPRPHDAQSPPCLAWTLILCSRIGSMHTRQGQDHGFTPRPPTSMHCPSRILEPEWRRSVDKYVHLFVDYTRASIYMPMSRSKCCCCSPTDLIEEGRADDNPVPVRLAPPNHALPLLLFLLTKEGADPDRGGCKLYEANSCDPKL